MTHFLYTAYIQMSKGYIYSFKVLVLFYCFRNHSNLGDPLVISSRAPDRAVSQRYAAARDSSLLS